jgi:hypothetical protein
LKEGRRETGRQEDRGVGRQGDREDRKTKKRSIVGAGTWLVNIKKI